MADGDVNAIHAFAFLIDDRVDCDCGLAGLTVADDQFALTAANWNHRINGFDAGLERLFNGLARHDTGSLDFDFTEVFRFQITATIDGHAECVHDATQELFADGYLHDFAGTLNGAAFFNLRIVAQNRDTDVFFF